MSKRLKDNIEKSFRRINEYTKTLPCAELEAAIEILQTMQEELISIGNAVEQCVEEATYVVSLLENIAEKVYKLSIDESFKSTGRCNEFVQNCKLVQTEVERVLPSRYEILFIPYKVTMWDAMESVYFAAMEEPDCNVSVMPVPYYHLSENKTELEMEYEGELFPKSIRITDYREYCISVMQPDVIIIHNPYDEKNRVTSLPERYFSSVLKKYTDHLVYIPYKVCSGAVNDMYCVLPGVKNAWRVYVQSNQVRDVYLKYHPQEKIVVTGSPKIDKIVYNETHKPYIPNVWKDSMENRKIFLLNTHLNQLMNDTDYLFQGLEQIIETFQHRKEIAVLWRPHPLSMETIRALNPHILDKYQKIIEQFKKLENGVYDETSDPHLAIAISDAYIGDWSSMLTMFGVTGKPIFVRNVALQSKNKINVWEDMSCRTFLLEASKGKKLESIYYEESISLEDYVDMILLGHDVLKAKRGEEFSRIAYDVSGNVGKNIWKNIYQEL